MKPILQHLAPSRLLAKIASSCANCRTAWFKNLLIHYFINRYPVNLTEGIEKNPFAYKTFNAFFTRHLETDCRIVTDHPTAVSCPADSTLSQWGSIKANLLLQAKRHFFTLADLLVKDFECFQNGHFMTLYLAPHDYHRVHMPIQGTLTAMHYIPGRLLSVNPKTASEIPQLFSKNERVIAYFDTAIGKMAVVMVGAMIVGNIETVWAGSINECREKNIQSWTYPKNLTLNKGAEMGCFKLGSTVILIFEKETVSWDPSLTEHQVLRFGQPIGQFLEKN